MPKTILITGATGTVGGQVLPELVGRADLELRAAVRDFSKTALLPEGVIPVLFDYTKPETFGSALSGADSVFLVTMLGSDGVTQAKAFLGAAKQAGVGHIVKLSVTPTVRDLAIGRWHADIDDSLKTSGMAWTILEPGGFMQNFVETAMPRPDIFAPVGNAKHNLIDTRDIASVAAKALTEPGHEGKSYGLSGGESLNYSEIAAIISEACGHTVRYVDVPEAAARQGMLTAKMPEWLVDGILELQAWAKAGGGDHSTNTIRELLGRDPKTFREFARDYADAWKRA